MRKFKTNSKYRDVYRYSFVDGSSKEIGVDEEVTEEDIALLHQLDDEEVNAERRESYHIPIHYGYFKAFDREGNRLLGVELSPIERFWQEQNHDREKQEQLLQKLRESITTLTPNQQNLIKKIFYEGKTQAEISREDGVSKMAITNRMKKIVNRLYSKIIGGLRS